MTDIPTLHVTWFQWIFVPVCVLLLLRSIVRMWRRSVPRRSGAIAILIWAGAATAIAYPGMTTDIAQHLGIQRGADFTFYVAILCGVAVEFLFYHRSRQLENLITELVRREAVSRATKGSVTELPQSTEP